MPKLGERKKNGKRRVWKIRVTEKEDNRARILAGLYADGNLSKWVVHGALAGERKKLK